MATDDLRSLREKAAEMKVHLTALADKLDYYYEKGTYVKAAGSAAAVAGGTLAVVAGVAATITTFGLAAPLAATGAMVATAGSVTSLGVSLANYITEKGIEYKWKEFKKEFCELANIPMQEGEMSMKEIIAAFEGGDGCAPEDILLFIKDIAEDLGQDVGQDSYGDFREGRMGQAVCYIAANVGIEEEHVFAILVAIKDVATHQVDTMMNAGTTGRAGSVESQAADYVASETGLSTGEVSAVMGFCQQRSHAIRELFGVSAVRTACSGAASGASMVPSAVGSVSRMVSWAQAGSTAAANTGSGFLSASKGFATGMFNRGLSLATQAKNWAMGGGTAASAGSVGGGMRFVSAVSKPIVMLNAFVLPLSMYELVQVSKELRDKSNGKSKAGDLLRKIAKDLDEIINSTA